MNPQNDSGPKLSEINTRLAQRVQEELGQNVYLCYQCIKCTSGCPVAEFFDWQPNQIMRALQLGQEEIALKAETPWLCAACQTCTTRCPQGLDIAGIMDFLTREALENGISPSVSEVNIFNQAFMREVRLWGRAFELGLMAEMKLRTRDILGDMDLGVKMIRRNKLPFVPNLARPPHKVKPLPGADSAVAYYPGCSLHSTAAEFNVSAKAVCEALELELIEPQGWVCCGSSAAHRSDPEAAYELPLSNLALIEQSGFKEVTMPCAACFNRHRTAQYELQQEDHDAQLANKKKSPSYHGSLKVTTLVQAIHEHVGEQAISGKVKKAIGWTAHGLLLRLPADPPAASDRRRAPGKPDRYG